ncbi:hypothetical protein GCM10010123_11030 [Pilimelia anulata]|uniref:Uncharacterized protein n=1 Tax=Pilimelia anulata TaxID=53371 RepID=A0A8J3F7X7_9ACTN|nr:hypothetical protein [Pilimelia anulata]GGJ83198.1 hypothetical protein GCM10010123_11030 [Pilimelia anulata]
MQNAAGRATTSGGGVVQGSHGQAGLLAGDLQYPARHRHGDPVSGQLAHERVESFDSLRVTPGSATSDAFDKAATVEFLSALLWLTAAGRWPWTALGGSGL